MADEGESSVWSFGWPKKIAAFFRPNREEKTLKMDRVLLYRRLETFLWWFGGFTWPEMGDQMSERESPARGERDSKILLRCECKHGTLVQLKVVNRGIADELILRLWLAWSASWSTVWMGWFLIWYGAVYRELGTPGDVAQQDRRADCFKGWDGFRF